MKYYKAPWSPSLLLVSALMTVLCLCGAAGLVSLSSPRLPAWLGLLPVAILAGGALCTIRGYSVTSDVILIHRLFWKTCVPLAGLRSAEFQPDAMRRSIRLFGNGGLFSFTGFFRNKALGVYRAFVTDPRQAVVLRFPARTVVVSPSAPAEFIRDIGISNQGPDPRSGERP